MTLLEWLGVALWMLTALVLVLQYRRTPRDAPKGRVILALMVVWVILTAIAIYLNYRAD